MGTDQRDLLRGGGSPLRRRLAHAETAHGNVVSAGRVGIETAFAYVNLDNVLVGVGITEVGPEGCGLVVALAIPRLSLSACVRGMGHVLQRSRFVKRLPIQVDFSGVMIPFVSIKPIAADDVLVWVIVTKKRVGQRDLPHAFLHTFPAGNDFGAFDDRGLALCRLIRDSLRVGDAPPRRIDAFAIGSLVHRNHVARLRNLRRRRDGLEWLGGGAVMSITPLRRNMVFLCRQWLGQKRHQCDQDKRLHADLLLMCCD